VQNFTTTSETDIVLEKDCVNGLCPTIFFKMME